MTTSPAKDLPVKANYRVDEVAKFFDVTTKTVYLWIEDGKLKAKKVAGRIIRIPREAIEECAEWVDPLG